MELCRLDKKNIEKLIDEYVESNSNISAISLCNHLINNHKYSSDLYSTGRPKLYFKVICYLEKLSKSGILAAAKKDRENCEYTKVMEIYESESELEMKSVREEEQLTLFR